MTKYTITQTVEDERDMERVVLTLVTNHGILGVFRALIHAANVVVARLDARGDHVGANDTLRRVVVLARAYKDWSAL